MDLQRPFFYQFEDTQWPAKLGLGALISLVPILNFALAGYSVQILRNVAANVAEPLPTWDELGKKFREGLILFLAGVIYAIPIFIFIGIPLSLLAASGIISSNSNLKDLAGGLAAVGGLTLVCLFGLFVLYAIFLSIIRPAILVIFSREGTFASCFRLGEIMRLVSTHTGPFFTVWGVILLAGLAVSMIVSFVGLIVGWIPCVGWLASVLLSVGSAMYLITADAHLFGQFRRVAYESEPVAAEPIVTSSVP